MLRKVEKYREVSIVVEVWKFLTCGASRKFLMSSTLPGEMQRLRNFEKCKSFVKFSRSRCWGPNRSNQMWWILCNIFVKNFWQPKFPPSLTHQQGDIREKLSVLKLNSVFFFKIQKSNFRLKSQKCGSTYYKYWNLYTPLCSSIIH